MPRCSGAGRRGRVMRFLQPCLLVILHRGEGHGYSLIDGLAEFGFNRALLDPSLVYRVLRDMEASGLVTSQWNRESLGPRRRIYQTTGEGGAALAEWLEELKRTRGEIDHLIAACKQVVKSKGVGRILPK